MRVVLCITAIWARNDRDGSFASFRACAGHFRLSPDSGHALRRSKPTRQANGPAARSAFPRCTGFDALTFVAGFLFSGHPYRSARYTTQQLGALSGPSVGPAASVIASTRVLASQPSEMANTHSSPRFRRSSSIAFASSCPSRLH
jgi:hypothetical protein